MLRNLQLLRALAAMMVVVGHLQPLFARVHPALAWVGLGRAGVDLFFVISGFVMVYTTRRGDQGPGEFARRRIGRIVPLYWLVTGGVFAIALAAPGLLGASRPHPAWLVKSLAFIPFDKGDGTFNPLIPVGWSLNYEMFFYAVFGLCLFAPPRWRYVLSGAAILALAAPGLAGVHFTGVAAEFYTRPILVEFAAGMALGAAFDRLPAQASAPAAAGLGALGAALAAGVLASGLLTAEPARVAAAGAASAGLLTCALILERSGRRAAGPALVLGDASYSIYLTHLFVTQAFAAAAVRLGLVTPAASALLILGALATVAIGGVACFRLFELPVTRALRTFPAARPRPQAAAAE
jgi:peptidoglycan/LPS O-acetylase OafA/YrhL